MTGQEPPRFDLGDEEFEARDQQSEFDQPEEWWDNGHGS